MKRFIKKSKNKKSKNVIFVAPTELLHEALEFLPRHKQQKFHNVETKTLKTIKTKK